MGLGLGLGLKLNKAIKKEEFRLFIFVKTIANGFNRWRQYNLSRVENRHINTLPTVETVGYSKILMKHFLFSKQQLFQAFSWKNNYFECFFRKNN
jgi:hypothetical protein